jgi:hypothetical protein
MDKSHARSGDRTLDLSPEKKAVYNVALSLDETVPMAKKVYLSIKIW